MLPQKNTEADVEKDATAKINVDTTNMTIEKIRVFFRPTTAMLSPMIGEKIKNARDCIANIVAAS